LAFTLVILEAHTRTIFPRGSSSTVRPKDYISKVLQRDFTSREQKPVCLIIGSENDHHVTSANWTDCGI